MFLEVLAFLNNLKNMKLTETIIQLPHLNDRVIELTRKLSDSK